MSPISACVRVARYRVGSVHMYRKSAPDIDSETERQRAREKETHRARETEIQRDRNTETQRDRNTRDKHRERRRETERERHTPQEIERRQAIEICVRGRERKREIVCVRDTDRARVCS